MDPKHTVVPENAVVCEGCGAIAEDGDLMINWNDHTYDALCMLREMHILQERDEGVGMTFVINARPTETISVSSAESLVAHLNETAFMGTAEDKDYMRAVAERVQIWNGALIPYHSAQHFVAEMLACELISVKE